VTPERYQQLKDAFRRALDYAPAERDSFLRQHCASDPTLIAEVLALLDSDSSPATSLDRPAVGTEFRIRTVSLSYTSTRH
jgi:hypothetical protein